MLTSEIMAEYPVRRLGETAAMIFAAVAVIALFLISNLTLSLLGIAYDTSGGAQWQKIHPATYIALIAIAFLFLSRLDPVALLDDVIRHHKGTLAFFLVWLLLLGHIVFVIGAPATSVVDTFLLPMVLLILLTRISERDASRFALFVHVAMAANAVLGIWEFVEGTRITPLVAQGVALVSDWRSTALLGHPLQNAAVTAVYAFVLIQGGGKDMARLLRPIALVLQFIALTAFGGRMAAALLIAFGSIAVVVQAAGIVRDKLRFDRPKHAALRKDYNLWRNVG